MAALFGRQEAIKTLLLAKAQVDHTATSDGSTPLIAAAQQGHKLAVQASKCLPFGVFAQLHLDLRCTCAVHFFFCVCVCVAACFRDALAWLCGFLPVLGIPATRQALLDGQADIDRAMDFGGATALYMAAASRQQDVVQLLCASDFGLRTSEFLIVLFVSLLSQCTHTARAPSLSVNWLFIAVCG